MTSVEWIGWSGMIFSCDIGAIIVWEYIKRKRNKRLDNTKCDDCQKVKRTKMTPDRHHWLCKECMKVYKVENKEII